MLRPLYRRDMALTCPTPSTEAFLQTMRQTIELPLSALLQNQNLSEELANDDALMICSTFPFL